jgi:glycerophosphoryl diester phosphodiesterase
VSLPVSVGFDVELKYPSIEKLNRIVPYTDMNPFVDGVLDVMSKHAGNRHVFFSSFDPFVCAMLRLKQNRWPVMQLFNLKKRWVEIQAMTSRIMSLAALHRVIGVEGFVIDSVHLMMAKDVITSLKDQGFMICTYGNLNNTRDGIEEQLALGVRGICTDQIGMCRTTVQDYLNKLFV